MYSTEYTVYGQSYSAYYYNVDVEFIQPLIGLKDFKPVVCYNVNYIF